MITPPMFDFISSKKRHQDAQDQRSYQRNNRFDESEFEYLEMDNALKLHGKKTYLTFRFENEKNAACAENNLSQIIAARSLSLFSTGYRKFTII